MSEFIDHLKELFSGLGDVRARRMFGGYGIFHRDLMFGLVADDVLYFKVDDESVSSFTDRGLTAFEYTKNGKSMRMSYYLAPEEIYDDPDEAVRWATLAFQAALRSNKSKKKAGKNR